jgi:tRNA pseudouridine13 synthase
MFIIEDLQEAQQRFTAGKIIYTGPIYGHKMKSAGYRAQAFEFGLLRSLGLNPEIFKPLRAPGSRRAGIVHVDDLTIKKVPEGLEFTFTLPSGTYATTLLREFIRK